MKRTAGFLGVALFIAIAFIAIAAACASTPEVADTPAEPEVEAAVERTIWDGVFTSDQASRGRQIAQAECLICHSESEWTSDIFLGVWNGRAIRGFYDGIRLTMPYDAPGRLSRQEYADIVAYILDINDAQPGSNELPSDEEGLSTITVTPASD